MTGDGRTGDGWEARLASALASGHGGAARRELGTVGPATDRETRDRVLDVLAHQAAGASPLAVELLTELVDELGIARTAVRQWLVEESAVDDVAQDTLISMATSVRNFTGEARFVTWLFTIAKRRSYDHLRRRRATEVLPGNDVGEAMWISSLIADRETVRQLVGGLPDHYRRALELRDIESLPYAEAADRLGVNVNTVKSHVARGRSLLAAMLSSDM